MKMQRHDEMRRILLSVIQVGLLRIRAYAHNGQSDQCSIEAEHLHNLPQIIGEPRLELLTHYLDVERICFMKSAANPRQVEPYWSRLQGILDEMRSDSNLDWNSMVRIHPSARRGDGFPRSATQKRSRVTRVG